MKNNIRNICLPALLVLLFTACGGGFSSEEYIARAKQFINGSEYKSAIIELKNALQENSNSAEARWLLGKLYLDTGDFLSAEKELLRARELAWSADDVSPALAKLLLSQGKYVQVRELEHVELGSSAGASVLATKAISELAQGETGRAKSYVMSALSKAPDSSEAQLASAQVIAAEGDINGAIVELENILSRDSQNSEAWRWVGDLRLRQRNLEEAVSAYDKAISADQYNYGALYKRALVSLQLHKFDAAQEDASALLRIVPRNTGANYIQGVIHFQAKRYPESIAALSIAEPAFKQFPLVLFFLGSAQLLEGKVDEAGVLAARFHDLVPDSIRGGKLLATIRLQQEKYDDVGRLLEPVLNANPNDVDALNLAANALLREGKTDEGITLLSQVAQLQPDSPVAQVRLGAGMLIAGHGEDAAQHMETALALDPEFQQADILLVLHHMQRKDYPAAIQAGEAYKARNLVSVTPYTLLGRVYLEAGQKDKARESLEGALSLDPGAPGANHRLAQLAVSNGNLAEAREYYEAILKHYENFLPALIQLAFLDAKEGDETSLIAHLERGIDAHPSALQPRMLLGRYYLSKSRPDQVAPLFSSLSEVERRNPQVLQLMAMTQLASKDPTAAKYTLDQLTESMPESAMVHHMMAMAAHSAGDMDTAQLELNRAVALDEQFLPSRLALAKLALENKSFDELRVQLKKLDAMAPESPDVLLLWAAAAKNEGDIDGAVNHAARAFELTPVSKTAIALASYKEAAGDIPGAVQVYDNWVAGHPHDNATRLAAANTLQNLGQINTASVHYEKILETDKDNLIALNNLAWFMREKSPSKALGYAHRASVIAPESPDVLDTLAVVEYMAGNYERAQRGIDRALKLSPDHPTLIYHSAMITAAQGDKSAAETVLRELLESGLDFPESAEARALLVELKD